MVRFSVTERCGKSSKCWNTMPTWLRNCGKLVLGSLTCVPLTKISPFWIGSSPFTVLISVDLPEPEGPQTTTTSPLLICTEQSCSTCTGPYHLDTLWMAIIGCWSAMAWSRFVSADDRDLLLQLLHRIRKG